MKRADFLTSVSVGSGALAAHITLAKAATKPRQPNVIIMITDDQGYGDLSCHGNPILKTPNMDRLHAESVRMTNFHVDPTCAPTRGALMTGKYAHHVRVWHTISGGNLLRETETTMADVFKSSGYRTGMFGKWHLGASYPYRPMDRGFEEWIGHGDGGTGTTADWFTNDRVNDMCIHNGEWERYEGWAPDVFYGEAMKYIKEGDRSKPFFVYLATYIPHGPHTSPDPKWAETYKDKVPSGAAKYFACIEGVDRQIGKLNAFLEKEGLAQDTIVIFMTDNGATAGHAVFNAGMKGRKGSIFDGGHRVPFFVRWPAGQLNHGSDVPTLAAHIDVLPTMIDLCNLTDPTGAEFDGQSFKPLLFDPKAPTPARSLVVEKQRSLAPGKGSNYAVMTQKWRLVQDNKDSAPTLYAIEQDLGQKMNIAKQHPEVIQALQADYEKYWKLVSPGHRDPTRPIIGSPHETETLLHSADMMVEKSIWNHAQTAAGPKTVGPYTCSIHQDGTYRFEVRRWPREANAPMAGVPVIDKTIDAWIGTKPVTHLIYGKKFTAMPIKSVSIKIGDHSETKPVSATDTSIVFTAPLSKGPQSIHAHLLDGDANILSTAYYVYVRKIQPR